MQVLLVCLVLFFVASELYQWMQGMTLPLPMLIVAGTALAIVSNLRSLSVPSWNTSSLQATLIQPIAPEPIAPELIAPELIAPELIAPEPMAPPLQPSTNPVATSRYLGVQLPNLNP